MPGYFLLAAVEQQPWLVVLGTLVGVLGTVFYNRNQGAQVAIAGLRELTDALNDEIGRLRTRVLHLEGQLMAAGIPITTEEP